ncbi:MAG: bifunctional proline dehydrogenase/L-glutamate gamma-semialdehyde dehydrogenase PutA [Formosimonas sp.]
MLAHHRAAIHNAHMMSEAAALARFAPLMPSVSERAAIAEHAAQLIETVRAEQKPSLMESMLGEYGLSTDEGVALMCLAEAMLRVPDAVTVNELIEDKIAGANWSAHRGQSSSSLINASTWGLMLTGQLLSSKASRGVAQTVRGLVKRLSEPVIRTAVGEMLKKLGSQFVLGETIESALKTAQTQERRGYTYSYDMLGEGAKTDADALRYLAAYRATIHTLTPRCTAAQVADNPGISVKLSALYPRYEEAHRADVLNVLVARTLELARLAAAANMGFNIDAEEVERLDLSLDVIEVVLRDERLRGWHGFGVVVQAYGKRAPEVLDWLHALASELDCRIMVRLVKGAYWDAEIKRAQVLGLPDFAVYTHKAHSDVAYLACAQKLLSMHERIYPQFATHNAHSVSAILDFVAGREIAFEFQRLHGMGEAVHDVVMAQRGTRCRIYAPVGAHHDLLAYLVRRLLENGANGSFVHKMADAAIPAAQVAADPWAAIAQHHAVTAPSDLFLPARRNSKGWDLTDRPTLAHLTHGREWPQFTGAHEVHNPATLERIGAVDWATPAQVTAAIGRAAHAASAWASTPVAQRAACLTRAADALEAAAPQLFALLTAEAGKTLPDAVAEVREAVDFCRYYATQAAHYTAASIGVVSCISPWNFPLAIFMGQVVAALVSGNVVLAKPAEQTPLIAKVAVQLLHEAGVPADALQLLCGAGAVVGAALTADPRINGVIFTGSSITAKVIQTSMAEHLAPDALLIAETGGLNAMIVDSSALPEQVVRDVMASAFQSAGQRCSALRILYVQEEIAESVVRMIAGAMDLLKVGNPQDLATDVGPVIDARAQRELSDYIAQADVIKSIAAPSDGYFVAPTMVRVRGIAPMGKEMFGPILHVATFKASELSQVVRDINQKGYGLTLGVHSRIEARVDAVCREAKIGNIYVNRNQIGAVVGSQPFGGHGLSGTGPKAGGPLYLSKMVRGASSDVHMDARKAERMAELARVVPPELSGAWRNVVHAASSLNFSVQSLPSPTGEANEYHLSARGTVLCLGPSPADLAEQVLAALLCGNRVVVRESPAWLAALRTCGEIVQDALEFDVVALFGDEGEQRHWRRTLAAQSGAVIPLMCALHDVAVLLHETHVCTDTTAAGGNAQLLAQTMD